MTNETESKHIDLTRRRLTVGGLATPVVLSTLASKNALADAAYRCTISGKLSGGSTHSTTDSCDYGSTVADLRAGTGWGTVNKDAEFRTIFKDVYWKGTGGRLRKTPVPLPNPIIPGTTPVPATFNDVITIDLNHATSPPHDVVLGRAAIAAYVGYVGNWPNYPLTLEQIQQMFDYAYRNVIYPYPGPSISPTVANLDRNEIYGYFTYLTTGGPPEPVITP